MLQLPEIKEFALEHDYPVLSAQDIVLWRTGTLG